MGVRNLHSFLRKTVPFVYQEVSLTKFAYKRIAIDLSIYLCKYKAYYKDRWLDAFLNLVTCLRQNEIHFVFILDSKSPPEKEEEKRLRQLQREKLKARIHELETAFKLLLEKNEISTCLSKYINPKNRTMVDIHKISHDIDRLKSNLLEIRTEDFVLVKQLFDLLKVPYYYGVSEAEATCAHLCLNGQVDAVLTEDTDILAYGCPFSLHKLNIHTNTVMMIEMKKLLTMLEISYPQFRDFCIMCGTDYNTNIPKIGPERAYRYIKEYKTIENLIGILDTSFLKYQAVRRLFTNDIDFDIPEDAYCGQPNRDGLSLFLFRNNCHVEMTRIIEAFEESQPLIFVSHE